MRNGVQLANKKSKGGVAYRDATTTYTMGTDQQLGACISGAQAVLSPRMSWLCTAVHECEQRQLLPKLEHAVTTAPVPELRAALRRP